MKIEQFEDKNLSHYSYAVLSECQREIILIDPARDMRPYLDYAAKHEARITGVIETHPHADFVSSHLELHKNTDAVIYCSELLAADYPHQPFGEGDTISFGKIKLKALNTPGHSPDSICVVLEHEGKDKAVFTGDTLFIGDCGRPDLRESVGNLRAKREDLGRQLYHSLREKLMPLNDDVYVYPAHGAGSLCGKALSEANRSTMGTEKISNWSLQEMDKDKFIEILIGEQPFIPKYFPYDVETNKKGARNLDESINAIPIGIEIKAGKDAERLDQEIIIVDTRSSRQFQAGHLPNSINIMQDGRFETWLGSIVSPYEPFYLAATDIESLNELLLRSARIGYEAFVKEAFVLSYGSISDDQLDLKNFRDNLGAYTIVDIRNENETGAKPVFEQALHIPLHQLRERVDEVPVDKPVVVHCAGGYRSAAGSSIIKNKLGERQPVFDLGERIKDFY